jgi:hypothetical protein
MAVRGTSMANAKVQGKRDLRDFLSFRGVILFWPEWNVE